MKQVFIHTDIFFKDTSSPNEVKYIPVIVKDFFLFKMFGYTACSSWLSVWVGKREVHRIKLVQSLQAPLMERNLVEFCNNPLVWSTLTFPRESISVADCDSGDECQDCSGSDCKGDDDCQDCLWDRLWRWWWLSGLSWSILWRWWWLSRLSWSWQILKGVFIFKFQMKKLSNMSPLCSSAGDSVENRLAHRWLKVGPAVKGTFSDLMSSQKKL